MANEKEGQDHNIAKRKNVGVVVKEERRE
jgi:hypothetical protein